MLIKRWSSYRTCEERGRSGAHRFRRRIRRHQQVRSKFRKGEEGGRRGTGTTKIKKKKTFLAAKVRNRASNKYFSQFYSGSQNAEGIKRRVFVSGFICRTSRGRMDRGSPEEVGRTEFSQGFAASRTGQRRTKRSGNFAVWRCHRPSIVGSPLQLHVKNTFLILILNK